jgi:hypothetical protein
MTKYIATIVLLISSGCKDLGEDVALVPPDIPVNILLAAPETVVVDGATLTLSTYLWHDFMPGPADRDTGLTSLVYVQMADSTKIPASIAADAVWIVNGQQVWKSFLTDANEPTTKRLCKIANHGPAWYIPVYVIVRVFGSNGEPHMLRASHQSIYVTF